MATRFLGLVTIYSLEDRVLRLPSAAIYASKGSH